MLTLLSLPALGACAPEEESAADRMFVDEVQPLFERACREGCHEPGGYNGQLYLGAGYGQDRIVNVRSTQIDMDLVEPGSLELSYMWHKLNKTHRDVGGTGEEMPYAEWPLPDEDLALVEEYIVLLGD